MLFVISFEILPFKGIETYVYNALIKSHNERLQQKERNVKKKS